MRISLSNGTRMCSVFPFYVADVTPQAVAGSRGSHNPICPVRPARVETPTGPSVRNVLIMCTEATPSRPITCAFLKGCCEAAVLHLPVPGPPPLDHRTQAINRPPAAGPKSSPVDLVWIGQMPHIPDQLGSPRGSRWNLSRCQRTELPDIPPSHTG